MALALVSKAYWPASQFSYFPAHVLTAVFYSALPYENVNVHGFLTVVNAFIALRFNDASSSDYPPDKN